MISENEVSDALTFLATTDQAAAAAKAHFMGLDEQSKTRKSVEFLNAIGTVAEREAKAYASVAYVQHLIKLEEANLAWETIRNQRLTAELKIELFRTLSANQRRGNL